MSTKVAIAIDPRSPTAGSGTEVLSNLTLAVERLQTELKGTENNMRSVCDRASALKAAIAARREERKRLLLTIRSGANSPAPAHYSSNSSNINGSSSSSSSRNGGGLGDNDNNSGNSDWNGGAVEIHQDSKIMASATETSGIGKGGSGAEEKNRPRNTRSRSDIPASNVVTERHFATQTNAHDEDEDKQGELSRELEKNVRTANQDVQCEILSSPSSIGTPAAPATSLPQSSSATATAGDGRGGVTPTSKERRGMDGGPESLQSPAVVTPVSAAGSSAGSLSEATTSHDSEIHYLKRTVMTLENELRVYQNVMSIAALKYSATISMMRSEHGSQIRVLESSLEEERQSAASLWAKNTELVKQNEEMLGILVATAMEEDNEIGKLQGLVETLSAENFTFRRMLFGSVLSENTLVSEDPLAHLQPSLDSVHAAFPMS
eukprot:ANDGO_06650.mRNA.1 hypothetical protein